MMLLAIDLGGTEAKIGLADGEGRIHKKASAGVSEDGYRTPIVESAIHAAKQFMAEYPCEIRGVAVSACGQIDPESGTVIGTNGRIPHYEGTNIKAAMERAFEKETWVLNDANAALLGECFTGRAKGLKDVILITLGTGVGGGVLSGGRLLGGAGGIAGELGHFTLRADGPACPCGKRGCFEHYASASALVSRCEAASGKSGLNGKIIFREAEKGNPVIQAEVSAWIRDIAEGLTGLIHIFNPEMVLIGGGVSAQEELLIRPLRERILQEAMPRFSEGLRIERALLGNDAGMVGAVRFWLDHQKSACF